MKTKILLFLVAVTVLGSQAIAQTTFPGLVGHWKFDEGSGTAVGDELGTTNGELVNGVTGTWTDGFMGKALDFSQASGGPAYARFDGSGAANIAESFTISMWIKADMLIEGEQSIISKGTPFLETNGRDGGWYHVSLKESKIRLMVWDVATLSSPDGELPEGLEWDPNTWYHVVAVRDVSTYELFTYLNGELISTAEDGLFDDMTNDEDLTFGSVAHGVQTEVGDALWGSNYQGALDEVQLYNVPLTAENVASIYQAYTNPSAVGDNFVSNMVISPNPVADQLVIKNASDITKLEVYNLAGVLVKTINASSAEMIQTNVSDLSVGTYIVKGYATNNVATTLRFTKR